ncbi:hypothetical protein CKO08_00405 [Halorhodospira halochloris]|nr:Sua5/YciO/YrdC/YwlC family protein [Halorhodospira halochloris]MBK1650706.1 hypothetical protein [Halorhodospira halochloris]
MSKDFSRSGRSYSSFRVNYCATALRRGGVVAYPTEAVWGLGCNPWDRSAVAKLLELKVRSPRKGLIVIGADIRSLTPFIGEPLSENVRLLEQAIAARPEPITWLVPAARALPSWVKGVYSSVAIRITQHPPAVALCRAYGGAIISSSANRSASPPATTAAQVRRYFGYRIDALLPGAVGRLTRPTPIMDLYTGEMLRA